MSGHAELEATLGVAVDVARAAGDVLLEYRQRVLTVETKTSATDPVSEADRASEQLILDRLVEAFPDDGILGEEDAGNREGTSGRRWVVDPLDGTVNYLYGIPVWCVSIACEDDDGPLVGVVHDPSRGEAFVARRGGGAWVLSPAGGAGVRGRSGERRELRVREPDGLGQTLVATGFAYEPAVRADQGRMAADVLTRVRDLRRGGAAALDLAWVAAGRIDAYYEFALQPWDWAAGRLLVEEAGGQVSTWRMSLGDRDRDGLLAGRGAAFGGLSAWLREHGAVLG